MPEWDQGACGCTNDIGTCCYTCWCPCLAHKEVADNIGDNNGVLYCLVSFCGLGCCVLTALGNTVAEKQGIDSNICSSAIKSLCDCICCYSCTVVNESRLIKNKQQGSIKTSQKMER